MKELPNFCTELFPNEEEFEKAVNYARAKGLPVYNGTSRASFSSGFKRLHIDGGEICGYRDHIDLSKQLISISEFYEMVDSLTALPNYYLV